MASSRGTAARKPNLRKVLSRSATVHKSISRKASSRKSVSATQKVTDLERFRFFPNLAPELRLKIYDQALSYKRDKKLLLCITGVEETDSTKAGVKLARRINKNDQNLTSRKLFDVNLMRANVEARDAYKEAMPAEIPLIDEGSIHYDPANTIVYLKKLFALMPDIQMPEQVADQSLVRIKYLEDATWTQDVEHLALSCKDERSCGPALYFTLINFPMLKSCTFVTDPMSNIGLYSSSRTEGEKGRHLMRQIKSLKFITSRVFDEFEDNDIVIQFMDKDGAITTEKMAMKMAQRD